MYDIDWLEEFEETDVLLDEKSTKTQAKKLLENYKTIFYHAKFIQMPKMTPEYSLQPPSFKSEPSNPVEKAVRKKIIAQEQLPFIIEGVDNMELQKSIPDGYYKRLLFLKYIDPRFFYESDYHVRCQLAKDFPNRVESKPNPYSVDEWIFYRDLDIALLGFAKKYKDGDLEVYA